MQSSRADHLIELGMAAYRSHLYGVAAERLQKAVEWDPQDWNTWFFLAMSYLKDGSYSQATNAFLHISAFCPNQDMQDKCWDALDYMNKRRTKMVRS